MKVTCSPTLYIKQLVFKNFLQIYKKQTNKQKIMEVDT